MSFFKSFAFKTAAVSSAFIMSASGIAFAMSYKDVPSSHWAYAAIDSVSNKGIMVGDLGGNFKPDDFIDKFETSKILAKMAGYKYSDVTAEEQLYYDRCYENNKAFINQYVNKFKKWNSTYNKEIAYLLEKEIYTQEDINQFVILVNNEERLRALSREEACMFLTKSMGKTSAAMGTNPTSLFKDDAAITPAYRSFVYYFRNLGIVKGDNDNNFKPKDATTKAAMAIMTDSVLRQTNGGTGSNNASPGNSNTNATIETAQGTIMKLYPTARAIQISSQNEKYNNKIYIVASTATVNVNSYIKTYSDLKEGMTFVGVFSGNELISVTATSAEIVAPAPTPNAAPPDATQTKLEGTIVNSKSDVAGSYIDFETRTINPRGEITANVKTYSVDKGAVIIRSGNSAAFTAIAKGDIALITISGSNVSRIELEEKDRSFTGTLVEKKYNEKTGIPILIINDSKGATYNFTITNATDITRKGIGTATWSELRVGDTVDIKSEYEVLKSIYAYGTKSSVDVWIKDIYISSMISKVTASDSDNKEKVYPIISGTADPYSLRVGSKVRLRLDSSEAESFSVLEDTKSTNATGVITNITRTNITIKDVSSSYLVPKDIKYDSNTVVIDSKTGKSVSTNYLDTDMKIYVVFSETTSSYAKTITILSN